MHIKGQYYHHNNNNKKLNLLVQYDSLLRMQFHFTARLTIDLVIFISYMCMASQPVLSYRTHKNFVLLLSTHCNAESMANVSLLLTTFLGWRIDTSFIGIYTPAPTICYILDATCCDNFIIMHLLYLLSYSNDGISQRSPTTRPDATPSRR